MQGYQVTFFTQQDRMHGQTPLAQWLLEEARRLGVRGATLSGALQGLGHDGSVHAINLFDVSDQPVQVTLVASDEELQRLFAHLEQQQVQVFYMKVAAEFGTLGVQPAAP
ncbi:DUF190 domain-containing protein [Stenotrophomonas sp. MMGLT7]|uniref:DUF190 domain-containing protein n=1 Tax=Stenotrophomonas sp. MMGLT7 TaxID=2901227 RepID=UPI001E53E594|nr:DUF190 domain-containing protein [Stenotrophomonas sp. MMGLT7]MCD7096845.1 DUF190 domain-containing protein [Stenotrophomonas sp. MMGLT7]